MMKKLILMLILSVAYHDLFAQGVPAEEIESQLENREQDDEEDLDDDELMQQLQSYASHPLNLNFAGEDELLALRILAPTQIDNLIRYRQLFGKLINIYELQAIPGWDVELIRKLLPFITIEENKVIDPKMIVARWKAGNDNLLLRVSTQFKSLVRYRHSYRNLLQLNITTERDAGEKFLDFTSFHFFARDVGVIKKLAIGDFVISMGQGLIMSQGMPLKKSANVLAIKKQHEILRPYGSSGEYNFHRGLASTFKWKNWQTTFFLSFRKLDANIESGASNQHPVVTSILTSGYHRTENEKEDKQKLKQLAFGASVSLRNSIINAGLNFVSYRFSIPIQKPSKPYNAFSFSGQRLSNVSIQYDRSFRNTHLFGEYAIDDNGNTASLNGLLVSLDRKLDCSFLYRSISPKYRSMYSGSFTENSAPVNENGLYAGCSFRLSSHWKLDSYVDVFSFPFLRYQVPEPSFGSDLFYQFTWTPSRQIEIFGRFRSEDRRESLKKQSRYQLTWNLNREIMIRERFETVSWFEKGRNGEFGFLSLTDFQYKPFMKSYRIKGRFVMFETDGSDSRIYAYESDVLYSGSVPGYSGKGIHFQINFNCDLKQVIHIPKHSKKSLEFWISWMQTSNFQQYSLPPSSVNTTPVFVSKFTSQIILSL